MSNHPEKSSDADSRGFAPRGNCPPDLGHYLRQATITLRRHSSWLNQAWCKHRQSAADTTVWKH